MSTPVRTSWQRSLKELAGAKTPGVHVGPDGGGGDGGDGDGGDGGGGAVVLPPPPLQAANNNSARLAHAGFIAVRVAVIGFIDIPRIRAIISA